MSKNTTSARAPNKRTLFRLGAVLTAAMLGVGAFSLVDTAGADPYWRDIIPNRTATTTENTAPNLPDARNDAARYRWRAAGEEPGTPPRPGYAEVWTEEGQRPAADEFTLPDGAEWRGDAVRTDESQESGRYSDPSPAGTQTEWTRDPEVGPAEDTPLPADAPDGATAGQWHQSGRQEATGEYATDGYELTGIAVYNMRGNPRLAPGERPAPDNPNWSPTPMPGNIPAHARDRVAKAVEELPVGDDAWIIYNTSNEWQGGNNQGNQGNASWFKVRGIYSPAQGDAIFRYEWIRGLQTPGTPILEFAWVREFEIPGTTLYRWQLQEKLQPTYLVMVPYVAGGNVQVPGGAVGTDGFTPEVWNWNRAVEAIERNSRDVRVPDGAVEGVPFEQAGQGGGNSSYFLFVTVDGHAYRADDSVLTILVPGGGEVQLSRAQGNTWVVVPRS